MEPNSGTTATQVSPAPTESEMTSFRQMIERALNAIVQASELAKTVESLQIRVKDLAETTEKLRRQNLNLDDMLFQARQDRDKATQELSQVKYDYETLKHDYEVTVGRVQDRDDIIADLRSQLEASKREANQYLGEALGHAEENDKLKAKLAEAGDWAKSIQAMLAPKQAEGVSIGDILPKQPETSQPAQDHISYHEELSRANEPSPSNPMPWEKPSSF